MELSKRLQAVAALVSYSVIADIGTDHGYVPIYLHKLGKLKKGFACDVNKGPLEKARDNIRLHGAQEVIEARLGSGLMPLTAGETETVVIAGMGGMLMIRLLQESPAVVASVKELILSPQHDVGQVRRYVHSIGFMIETEQMVKEDGKYYTLMRCVHGEENYTREIDYLYGKRLLLEKNFLLKEVLLTEDQKYCQLEEVLMKNNTYNATVRLEEVGKKHRRIREALECMQQ